MYTVYVIKCKTPFHYYVGYSRKFHKRAEEHAEESTRSSDFVKVHGYGGIAQTEEAATAREAVDLENKLTLAYMLKYGINNVAGGLFPQVEKSESLKKEIVEEIERFGKEELLSLVKEGGQLLDYYRELECLPSFSYSFSCKCGCHSFHQLGEERICAQCMKSS
jgi:predicted GIY-YIG superfamily endonuclease